MNEEKKLTVALLVAFFLGAILIQGANIVELCGGSSINKNLIDVDGREVLVGGTAQGCHLSNMQTEGAVLVISLLITGLVGVLLYRFATGITIRRWLKGMLAFALISLFFLAASRPGGGSFWSFSPTRSETMFFLSILFGLTSVVIVMASEVVERFSKRRMKNFATSQARISEIGVEVDARAPLLERHGRTVGIVSMVCTACAVLSQYISNSFLFWLFGSLALGFSLLGLIIVPRTRWTLLILTVSVICAAVFVLFLIKIGSSLSFAAMIFGIPIAVASVLGISWTRLVFLKAPPVVAVFLISLAMLLIARATY